MSTLTNKTMDFATEAMNLRNRLWQAYVNEDRKNGDPRRIERLLRLERMAANRWRRIMGMKPMYGKEGTR
jgi:hypothetical protein